MPQSALIYLDTRTIIMVMAKYRLASLAELARQMGFAPQDVRALQVARAEDLLHAIDPDKAYPLDFVIHRITEYRPAHVPPELLAGAALRHDLGLLIEQVSAGLNLRAERLAEPLLTIEDLCARLGVTSKTIQRWRRVGLPARRAVFHDGRQRVGFLLSSVERFLARRGAGAAAPPVRPPPDADELGAILRNARRLALDCGCCAELMCRRLARMFGRSAMAMLYLLRRHDQEHPADAVLPLAARPADRATASSLAAAYRAGTGVSELARRYGLRRSAVYHAILAERIRRLTRREIRFHDDPLFHQSDAARIIESLAAPGALPDAPDPGRWRMPRGLPAGMEEVYRTPLLDRAAERGLFTKLNFHKYLFVQARRRLDPELARWRDVRGLQSHLDAAAAVRQQIVRANLRLVLSVARRHAVTEADLLELLSEGVITLTRAVDGFDIARGNRFSTYATWALMKGFARTAPRLLGRRTTAVAADDALASVADGQAETGERLAADRDELAGLLARLTERQRAVIAGHFALDGRQRPATYDELGRSLGLSAGRVRRIEAEALARLREMARASDES